MSDYDRLPGQLRPITKWPGDMTPDSVRRYSPFKADFTSTLHLLRAELAAVEAGAVVCEVPFGEGDFKIDGQLRAQAKAQHPGIIVSFNPGGDTTGRLQFAADTFTHWKDNARAVALGLEALRKVDRYGITSAGQQYAGFKALTTGDDGSFGMYTVDQATTYVKHIAAELGQRGTSLPSALKLAIRELHPDRGGDETAFRKLLRAKELLDRAA